MVVTRQLSQQLAVQFVPFYQNPLPFSSLPGVDPYAFTLTGKDQSTLASKQRPTFFVLSTFPK